MSLSTRIFATVLTFLAFFSFGLAAQDQQADEKKETTKKFYDPDMTELSGRDFMTSDHVLLSGSFYPGNANKDTIPVILLHGQRKSREEFVPLIAEMKKRGYAVLAFDFRGHGESTTRFPAPEEQGQQQINGTPGMGIPNPGAVAPQFFPGMGGNMPGMNNPGNNAMPNPSVPVGMMPPPPPPPKPVEYLEADFKRVDYENLYKFDCLPFYRFLVQENNAGKLNLNKLVIVGVDMGGTVGGQMTKQLWSNSKGKNVRSLIIVSPNYDQFSKTLLKDSKCFHKEVPLRMFVGQLDRQSRENALNLREDILGKERKKDDDPTSLSSPVPITELPTERQGGELLRESKLGIPQKIADHIDETLAKRKERELKWRKM
ncbi:MAG: alpha/beta fold hydrolase [Planctomycetaceae bacterium]|nr:alpha/beta fold hydrolase [Planctomycetaceae bacterium]